MNSDLPKIGDLVKVITPNAFDNLQGNVGIVIHVRPEVVPNSLYSIMILGSIWHVHENDLEVIR